MQSQHFFRMALTLLVIKYANAESRRDIQFRLKVDEQFYYEKIYDELEDMLQKLGIKLDEESSVYIHEESRYIDFSCFNCITSHIHNNEEIQHSHNWRVEK